jgi:acyl-CoA reductase-like NAD-dependent aldehyde dehydrogenase
MSTSPAAWKRPWVATRYKNSGYGREKGVEALHHHTQLKCVTVKL